MVIIKDVKTNKGKLVVLFYDQNTYKVVAHEEQHVDTSTNGSLVYYGRDKEEAKKIFLEFVWDLA